MKTYIIHHSRDLDGWSSAAIIKSKYPNGVFIPHDYSRNTKLIDKIKNNSIVYMLDISLEISDIIALAKRSNQLIWIDHHKTAIEKFNNYTGNIPNNLTVKLEIGKAACELTWEYMYPTHVMNPVIKLLGRYDVWDNKDIVKWDNEILPFQFGMSLIVQNANTFPLNMITHPTQKHIDHIIDNGNSILKYQLRSNEIACRGGAFEFKFHEYRCIALNIGMANSSAFDSVWDETKYDIMFRFAYTGRVWNISIYATNDEIDCSAIATQMGGGGHRGAAGFRLTTQGMIKYGILT